MCMKKVMVIGCPGSGKTTFAEKLNKITGLPLFYLDAIWHKPDRSHISRDEFDKILAELLAHDSWIIDGNYSRTLEARLKSCDTVFMLDFPTDVCMQGVVERIGKKRKDMPWVDTELDQGLKLEIEKFPKETRPHIFELLEKYGDDKNVVVFKSRDEADAFLRNFKKG